MSFEWLQLYTHLHKSHCKMTHLVRVAGHVSNWSSQQLDTCSERASGSEREKLGIALETNRYKFCTERGGLSILVKPFRFNAVAQREIYNGFKRGLNLQKLTTSACSFQKLPKTNFKWTIRREIPSVIQKFSNPCGWVQQFNKDTIPSVQKTRGGYIYTDEQTRELLGRATIAPPPLDRIVTHALSEFIYRRRGTPPVTCSNALVTTWQFSSCIHHSQWSFRSLVPGTMIESWSPMIAALPFAP